MFQFSKVLALAFALTLSAFVHADPVKDSVALELGFIKRIFETGYAPTQWKKEHFGWNLQAEYNKAITELSTKGDLTGNDYRQLISKLLTSTKDYHVGVQFHATEAASLPFQVGGTAGRYFVVWIEKEKLSGQTFPISIGDEVISFGGRPILDVVREIKNQGNWGVETTDWRLAELYLTRRGAALGLEVPSGPIDIVFKKANGDLLTRQLVWDYKPETVEWKPSADTFKLLASQNQIPRKSFRKPQMSWGMLDAWMTSESQNKVLENPYSIGGRKSFVPQLGTVIWESAATDIFHAYIYKHESGKLIGVVRMPHFMGDTAGFNAFKAVIQKFESTTDAMVIDQVNNPGGSVFYVLALMSVLSKEPIKVPDHHITLWPAMIDENAKLMKQLETVKNDEDAKKIFGVSELDGFPINFQFSQSTLQYTRQVQAEWAAGHKITKPLHLWGADKVNPDPQVNYSKPIMVLVNELDFSGGDFFPAILQDNGRAKVFGLRTSGAGGYVLGVEFPSSLGLKSFSFTGSLARRMNNQPIENLGVTPDIAYDYSVNDLQKGYPDYKAAINKAVGELK